MIARGDEVTCVDDLSSGRRENLACLLDEPRFALVLHDVTALCRNRPESPRSSTSLAGFTVEYSEIHPHRVRQLSRHAACLELAETLGARLLQASTSEVYGDPSSTRSRRATRAASAAQRACVLRRGQAGGRDLCADFARTRGLDVRVARVFNT